MSIHEHFGGNCPKCNVELIELRVEKEAEPPSDYSAGTSYDYGPQTYWGFYGYWCRFCEQMYESHTKTWVEPWKFQSLSEKGEER